MNKDVQDGKTENVWNALKDGFSQVKAFALQ